MADELNPHGVADEEITVRYIPELDDLLMLGRYYFGTRVDTTGWHVQVTALWGLVTLVLTLTLVLNRDTLIVLGILWGIFLLGLWPVVRFLWGQWQIKRRLLAAARLAHQGKGPDPFASSELTFGPDGRRDRGPLGERHYPWDRFVRIDWFKDNLIFVHRFDANQVQLYEILPARVFLGVFQAREAYEKLKAWHFQAIAARFQASDQPRQITTARIIPSQDRTQGLGHIEGEETS